MRPYRFTPRSGEAIEPKSSQIALAIRTRQADRRSGNGRTDGKRNSRVLWSVMALVVRQSVNDRLQR